MTTFETATAFFHACESLDGWAGCRQYTADSAAFSAQCEPIADLTKIDEYCEWMVGVGNGPLKGCRYTFHNSAYDEANSTLRLTAPTRLQAAPFLPLNDRLLLTTFTPSE